MGIKPKKPGEYFLDVRVKKNGHELRERETFHGTRSAAEERFFQIKREMKEGAASRLLPAKTFGQVLARYRDSRGGEIPRSERSIYEELERDLGTVDIARLEDALQQYAGIIRRLPSKTTGEKLSNASLNRRRAMVAASLNLAVELKILEKSPLNKAIWPKLKEIPRDRYLDPLEAQRLMGVVTEEAPHLYFLFWYALQVPCRKSELVRMGRPDLDLFNNAIRVHNGTTKNDEGTWKPIPPNMVTYFRSIPADCPYLFYRKEGEAYYSLGDFKKAWARCLKLAGIKDFRFHDTRHIAATEMVNAGTPERVVMAIAGWETNMLSTYWKNLGKKHLGLVRFTSGNALPSGHQVDTREEDGRNVGDSEVKAANS